jgi:chemotaxis protein methyltransferase CheR
VGLQQRYFQQRGSKWILNESIRKMVTFRNSNILTDTFSSSNLGLYDLDLIICRNVFLYFHTDAISHVVKKMSQTLTSEGYFLTGHGELPANTLGWLQAKNFPDSVIYQRPQTMCAIS